MASTNTQKQAAKQFVKDWSGKGYEKGEARQSDSAELTPYQQAHRANDAAVLEAYGFPKDATESDIVARLFKMYQELTK